LTPHRHLKSIFGTIANPHQPHSISLELESIGLHHHQKAFINSIE